MFGAALSGLTSYAVVPSDTRQLEASLNKKLRAVRLGAVRVVDGTWEKMTNHEVLRWWRIPPVALELRVQRLLFFGALIAEPANHQHVLAALLLEFDL